MLVYPPETTPEQKEQIRAQVREALDRLPDGLFVLGVRVQGYADPTIRPVDFRQFGDTSEPHFRPHVSWITLEWPAMFGKPHFRLCYVRKTGTEAFYADGPEFSDDRDVWA